MSNENKNTKLTELQIEITQNCGTEKPFDNEYWNHKEEGIYVDLISRKPLFCSIHKYDSGSGWPSFYDVIEKSNLIEKADSRLGYERTEIKCKDSNSHLGHVFDDGPITGLRYCINSASIKFIPKSEMAKEGYEDLMLLFKMDKD